MKMCVFFTAAYESLYRDWLLGSLRDDFELMVLKSDKQICPTSKFMEIGWIETMLLKIDFIIHVIQKYAGEIFICTDVDIQFFKPIESDIAELIMGKDMLLQ